MFDDLISVTKPKITVISPSLNHGRFLVDTIESITCQSYRNFEHIVVDGGSNDDSVDILKQYPHIKWISEKDENITDAYRKAFDMSSGEYIIQCCVSDGFLDKDWFKRCVEVLESGIDISLVWGLPQYMLEDGSLSAISYANLLGLPVPQKMKFFPFWLATGFFFPEGNYCIRREVFDVCFPKFNQDDPFEEHPILGSIGNFNSLGYLSYFIPVVANYGRWHDDQRGKNRVHIDKPLENKYYENVKTYRKNFLKGKIKHSFRNSKSEIIRTIDADEIELYKKEIRRYRITQSIFWSANLELLSKKIQQYTILNFFRIMLDKIFKQP